MHLNSSGSLFHSFGAIIAKARHPLYKFPGCSGVWRIAIYRLTIAVGVAARSGSIVLASNEELCCSILYVISGYF